MRKLSIALASLLVLAACPSATPSTPPAPAAPEATPPAEAAGNDVERAKAAVAKLKGTLVGELTKAIAAGGPASAVNVCSDVAARIKDEVTQPDLAIGRTSSKLRNPKNAGPAWVAPVLAELESAPKEQRTPRSLKLADGRTGYVEPLVTAPLCLQCHGAELAPEVKAALAAKYPEDKATGFAEGDLRGVAWVEVGLPPAK